MRSPHRSAVAAVLLVSLTACSPSADDPASPSGDAAPTTGTTEPAETAETSGTDASPPDAGPPADDALLAFAGRQLGGGTFDGSTLTGDVIVWFWTPW